MKRVILPILLFFIAYSLTFSGCRKNMEATEVDYADYGWVLYAAGTYAESNSWFLESVNEDSSYKDGYNGIGWTFGKLMELDSSIHYFKAGLSSPQDPNIIFDTKREIWAGLCFANNSLGQDSLAIVWGDSLILELEDQSVNRWYFSRDTTLNILDIRLSLAVSNYAESQFATSLLHVQDILQETSPTVTFIPDILTVTGRRSLAQQIDDLQQILSP